MKSKLIIVLTLVILLPFVGIAQQCDMLSYHLFKGSSTKSPVTLNVLGTSPQFGEIPSHTGVSAYNHLKNVYNRNVRNSRREIDNFLRALGYSGFKDPSFTSESLMPETLPAGTTGWMGAYSKGHKYAWSVLGNSFPTFKINSKSGDCYIYIMKKCGNAFYIPGSSSSTVPSTSSTTMILPPAPKATCKTQTITITGAGQVQSGDVWSTTKTVEIVAVNSLKPTEGLLIGSYPITVRSAYDLSVKGNASYSKTVEVCIEGDGNAVATNLALPMNLNYAITKQDVMVGTGDKAYVTVDPIKYAALKKAYKGVSVPAATTGDLQVATKNISAKGGESVSTSGSMSGDVKCADQKINFIGKTQISDGVVKSLTNNVTIIGVYKKKGKLDVGEMADKYLCLGQFAVPVKSAYEFTTTGGSDISKTIRVCTKDGVNPADQTINVPVDMTYAFNKQDVTLGDANRIYVSLSETEYNALRKNFNRCCVGGGDGSCK